MLRFIGTLIPLESVWIGVRLSRIPVARCLWIQGEPGVIPRHTRLEADVVDVRIRVGEEEKDKQQSNANRRVTYRAVQGMNPLSSL